MENFYLTAAIDYSNGNPHMGHAFEKIGLDAIARFMRGQKKNVHCLVGTDEHSQNVVKKAEEAGLDPQKYCDRMAKTFQAAYDQLQVSYDRFIRTTDADHKETVQWISQRIYDKGDIYQGNYEGYYCTSCEAFYQNKDLEDGLCPVHKREPTKIKEQNYFFALSKYQEKLIQHIQDHPGFIQPESRKNEVLGFLKEPLQDISISRANSKWGIPLPFDEKAIAYVWFDALTNYFTAIAPFDSESYKKFWPADLHVVGKDITRFHCVIWPIMLMSADIPIPKTVWGHGFVNLAGEKMSKTTGTIIDPIEIANSYGTYALRYFLLKEIPWTKDGDFSVVRMIETHNADLSNGVGNLLNRTISMAHKYFNGELNPKGNTFESTWNFFQENLKTYCDTFFNYLIHESAQCTHQMVRHLNLLIDQKKPWAMAKDENQKEELESLLHTCLCGCIILGNQLEPFIPDKAQAMIETIGFTDSIRTPEAIAQLKTKKLLPQKPEILFPRLEIIE